MTSELLRLFKAMRLLNLTMEDVGAYYSQYQSGVGSQEAGDGSREGK